MKREKKRLIDHCIPKTQSFFLQTVFCKYFNHISIQVVLSLHPSLDFRQQDNCNVFLFHLIFASSDPNLSGGNFADYIYIYRHIFCRLLENEARKGTIRCCERICLVPKSHLITSLHRISTRILFCLSLLHSGDTCFIYRKSFELVPT